MPRTRLLPILSLVPTVRGMVLPATSKLPFSKYHGLGNDFVLIDERSTGAPSLSPDEAMRMCDRNFGVGADGVIFVLPPDTDSAKYRMRIYNSDGSEPEMCGNGIRCMARFVADVDAKDDLGIISTLAGPLHAELFSADDAARGVASAPVGQGAARLERALMLAGHR